MLARGAEIPHELLIQHCWDQLFHVRDILAKRLVITLIEVSVIVVGCVEHVN